jgi:hypothetical protein
MVIVIIIIIIIIITTTTTTIIGLVTEMSEFDSPSSTHKLES